MKLRNNLSLSTTVTILALQGVVYADINWRSESIDGLWSNSNNWWDGSTLLLPGSEIIRFGNDVQTVMTNDAAATTRHQIWFDAGATTARTIGGTTVNNFVSVGAAGPLIRNDSTATHVINFPMRLDADLTANANAGGLTFGGVLSGTGGLLKTGANTLTLSGANTFSGKTAVNAGILSVSSDGNLGTAPASLVADQLAINGGTLKTGSSAFTLNANRGITIGASGATLDTSAAGIGNQVNILSPITGNGPLVIKAAGNMGAGGGGRTTLSSTASDFTGAITVQSGLVEWNTDASFGNAANTITLKSGGGLIATAAGMSLPATRAIALDAGTGTACLRLWGSASLTLNSGITGTGNLSHVDGGTLTLAGANSFIGNLTNAAGTLVLSGANSYTGYTFMGGSTTLRLDADNTLPDATDVLFYGGATFNVNSRTETIGGLMVGSASDTSVTVNLGASGSTGTLKVTDNSMPAGSPTNAGGSFYGKITGFGNVNYAHSSSDTASWDWYNTNNDFTGNIIITRGRLRTALGAGGIGALGNAGNDLVFDGDIVPTLGSGQGKASLQGTASGALNLAATRDIILNTGKEGTMYVWGGNTYTINGKVTGGGNLRKEDSGTLLLANTANDFTGFTRIASGSVKLGASGVIPDASGVEISSGTLDTGNFAETVASLSSNGGNGGNLSGGNILTVNTAGSADFSGTVNGTHIRMAGTGTQTLSGTADNVGGTASVDSGALVLGKTSTSGVHAVGATNAVGLTINGGTARLGGSGGDQIYHDTIVHQTGGTFDLNGTSEGFRGLTGTGGTVTNNGGTASTLTVGETSGSAGSYAYSGTISDGTGTTALAKTGSGTQTLEGANTYTGNTTVNGGTLKLGANGSINSSTQIIVGASTTLDVSAISAGWTVGSAQTLTGHGTVVGDTSVDGDIRPGSSPGTLTFTGDLGLNSASDWLVEIGGTNTTDFDRLVGSGALTASGNILVSLINAFDPASGDSFQIANFSGYSTDGAVFDFTNASLAPGLAWDTTQFSSNGTITVIPEPDAIMLGGLGLLGLLLRHRRR